MSTIINDPITQPPEPKKRSKLFLPLLILLMLLALGSGYALMRLAQRLPIIGPAQLHGYAMQSPTPVANFTLTDHNGEQVSLYDFRGKVTLIYFGYAYCPDVCPTTLSKLAKAKASLSPAQQADVQVLMVTVDPARDTPELLARYLGHFDASFLGLTGSEEEILAASTPLGIFYEKKEGSEATGYLIDHTATVAVLDRNSHLRLVYPFNTAADDVASDLNILLRQK